MSNQSAASIFFREGHRAYLEHRDVEVLDNDVIYLNLYRQKTHATPIRYNERWSYTLRQLVMGLMIGVPCFPIWLFLAVTLLQNLTADGSSDWREVYTYFAVILLIPLSIGVWIGGMYLWRVALQMAWGPPRLRHLLHTLAKEGKLIEGRIESAKIGRHVTTEVRYRFTTPTGKELVRVFHPGRAEKTHEPGTPVWVLYLNDEISVLL